MKAKILYAAAAAALIAFAASAQAADGGKFLANRHVERGLDCTACHVAKDNFAIKVDAEKHEACVGCHGWYDVVSKKTQPSDPEDVNPHSQHDGNLPCTTCHKGHKKGVNYCGECHMYSFNVP